jgi:hypothetical protein
MKRREIFLAVAAKELYVTERLGAFVFNSETSIFVLDVMRRGNYIIGDLEKFLFIATIWAFKQVSDCGLVKWHKRFSFLHFFLKVKFILKQFLS